MLEKHKLVGILTAGFLIVGGLALVIGCSDLGPGQKVGGPNEADRLAKMAEDRLVEEALSADGDMRIIAIPFHRSDEFIQAAECWTTDGAYGAYPPGQWPHETDFYPGDILAYYTGPIAVRYEDGVVTVSIAVQHYKVGGLWDGKYLPILDRGGSVQLRCLKQDGTYCDTPGEMTYWYLWMALPQGDYIPDIPLRKSRTFAWDMDVSGFVNYSCSGTWTIHPPE